MGKRGGRASVAATAAFKVPSITVASIDQHIVTAVIGITPSLTTATVLGTATGGDVAIAGSTLTLFLPSLPCQSKLRVIVTTQFPGEGLVPCAHPHLLLPSSWVAVNNVPRLTGVHVQVHDNDAAGGERQGERKGGAHGTTGVLVSFSSVLLVVLHFDAVVAVAVHLRSARLLTTAMTRMTSQGSAVAKLPAGVGRQGTAGLGRNCPLLLTLPRATCTHVSRSKRRGCEVALVALPCPPLPATDFNADEVHGTAIDEHHGAAHAQGIHGAAHSARGIQQCATVYSDATLTASMNSPSSPNKLGRNPDT